MGRTSASPGNTGCWLLWQPAACWAHPAPDLLQLGSLKSTKKHLAHAPQRPSAVCPFPWLRSPSAWKPKKMKLKSLLLRYYPPGTEFPPAGSGFPAWDSLGQRGGRNLGRNIAPPLLCWLGQEARALLSGPPTLSQTDCCSLKSFKWLFEEVFKLLKVF